MNIASKHAGYSGKAVRHALGCLLMGAFAATSSSAQEPSVVLKQMDAIEKRLAKVEAETGRLARLKAAPAASVQGPRASDSSIAAMTARLDSLTARIRSLESASQDAAPKTASAPGQTQPAASARETSPVPARETPSAAGRDGEIAALIGEVQVLTALLKGGASLPPAASKSAPAPESRAPIVPPASPAAAAKPAKALELKGDIQIQGERKLTSQSKRDNLDDFWGRLNFGAEYSDEEFQSKINIRIFPEGFGFEPLTGASFDTSGQGSLKVQSQAQSRVVVNHAWAKYALGGFRLKVGRFETLETYSDNYGNYVDLGPGGKFMSRPAAHNALELASTAGDLSGSAMLGTGDRKLNRGFLRLYGKYAPTKRIQASLGYRANLFDTFRYENDPVLHRFDAGAIFGLPLGWKVFSEAALLQAAGRKADKPLLIGVQPNTGKVLDLLSVEAEWTASRRVAGEYKEWLFNAHARKAMGRVKLDFGVYSDLLDPDRDAFSAGLRMTSNIK